MTYELPSEECWNYIALIDDDQQICEYIVDSKNKERDTIFCEIYHHESTEDTEGRGFSIHLVKIEAKGIYYLKKGLFKWNSPCYLSVVKLN